VRREFTEKLEPLISEYRDRCLWFLREDFIPDTPEQAIIVLDLIERHGDQRAFRELRKLKSMAITKFQQDIFRLIASDRKTKGTGDRQF
jgi:hypothetical protein